MNTRFFSQGNSVSCGLLTNAVGGRKVKTGSRKSVRYVLNVVYMTLG